MTHCNHPVSIVYLRYGDVHPSEFHTGKCTFKSNVIPDKDRKTKTDKQKESQKREIEKTERKTDRWEEKYTHKKTM